MPIGTTNFPTSLDTAVELVEVADNALTTLSAELSAVATTASVVSTTLFPTTGILTIGDEKISYTGKTGTTFTGLTRGVGGTSAAIHASAANVECLIVEEWHRVHSAAIIAIETKLGAGAAIAVNKFAPLTASIVPVTDASGFLSSSAVTPTELGHLSGVTSAIQTQLGAKQPLDATLTALAAYNTNGLLTQTAADTFAGRTITGTASRLAVTNGNGVAGNPTLDIDAGYVGQASITTLGTITTGVWNGTAIGASFIGDLSAVYSPVGHNHTGVYQPLDTDLTDIAALSANGLLRRSAGTWAMDSATYLTANQTITLSGDVSGSGATAITTTIGAGVVTNAMLAGSIAYSKLSLTGAILNADLAGSIAYSKLSLTGAILNADLAGSIAITKITMNTARLLGRTTASAGAVEELSLGYGLAMASGVLRTAVPSVVVLTDGATVSVDATLRGPYRLTLGGNRTLANPTGAVDGQIMTFEFIQDATGSRTITLDTKFIYGADITAVVLSTAANKRDFMTVQYNSSLDKFAVIAFTKTYA